MNKKTIITILLTLVAMAGVAQEIIMNETTISANRLERNTPHSNYLKKTSTCHVILKRHAHELIVNDKAIFPNTGRW